MDSVLLLLIGLVLLLVLLAFFLYQKALALQNRLSEVLFSKESLSVKYGKLTEQWIPFAERFPFSPDRFRFLGNPIDGVSFEDDKIVFCEFKTASSQLNPNQKKIKDLVENKKVEWLEFRIK